MISLKKNFRTEPLIFSVVTKTFGDWLKTERLRAKLTQEKLAEKARNICTSAYISTLERNADIGKKGRATKPDITIVDALAVALGVPIREARQAAGYAPPVDDTTDSTSISEFSRILSSYERLSPPNRRLARKLITGTINSISEAEKEGILPKDAVDISEKGSFIEPVDSGSEFFIRETTDDEREKEHHKSEREDFED